MSNHGNYSALKEQI